jgi:protein disulfide-isomerase A1
MIRGARYVLAALAFAFALTAYAEIQEDEGVLVLTDENFDDAVAQHDLLLVEFYAPWCGHCKKLAPEWAKAAQTLKAQPNPLPLAKVDATEAKQLAERFEIRGFPTIKLFRGGVASDYTGGRTEQDIVTWLNKKTGPAVRTVNSEADIAALEQTNPVFVLGFFSDAEGAAAKAFSTAAAQDDSLVYATSTNGGLRAKYNVAGNNDAVVVIKPFDEKQNTLHFNDAMSASDISTFAQAHSRPLVQFFTKESAQAIFSSPIQVHVLFFSNEVADYHEDLVDSFTEVARPLRGKALVVHIPPSENRILEYFGITESDLPTAYIADMRTSGVMKKYKLDAPLTADSVTKAANDFFEGKLKPSLKSEEPAPEDTTGPVKVVKGKTFHDLVVNNDKDVFLEFYAPWCGHCKKLAPIWDELGEKFANNGNLVIAKVDATANEVDYPGVEVQGFPTLYFFKGNDKQNPVRYEGNRELDALSTYIQETATNKVSGSDEL